MDLGHVGLTQFINMGSMAFIGIVVPLAIALIWKFKKKERFTTILIGAATFMLFAILIEKPLQALVISLDHPVKRFLDATPVAWAFVVGLFPGIFEETGRLVAYKTVLRKRKNKETGISHGIGHGGFEVMYILGSTFITYIIYGIMINNGTFETKVLSTAPGPEYLQQGLDVAEQIVHMGLSSCFLMLFERIFAALYHIGASMLVFYACRDKEKFWLYPLAILLHTLIDFIGGLFIAKVITNVWIVEAVLVLTGLGTFFGAYFFLYRRDKSTET